MFLKIFILIIFNIIHLTVSINKLNTRAFEFFGARLTEFASS